MFELQSYVKEGNVEQDETTREKWINIKISNQAVIAIKKRLNGDTGDPDDIQSNKLNETVRQDFIRLWELLNPS